MKYQEGPSLSWGEVPPHATIQVRPHRQVELGERVLLLCQDSPGWAAVAKVHLPMLQSLDGMDWDNLTPHLEKSNFRRTLERLYRAGLIAVDGRTGLRGEAECVPRLAPPPGEWSGPDRGIPERSPAEGPVVDPPFPSSLLIKLTGGCNWACTYCYDFDKNRFHERLGLESVAEALESMAAHHREIFVMFHGGEPLLQFAELKRIVDYTVALCTERDTVARFSVQTNGSLLDEEKIRFLERYSFDVGMSLDGPPEVNDLARVDRKGNGTAQVVLKLFERHPDFMRSRVGFITTVTSQNVSRLKEIAHYLRELGVRSWKTAIFDVEGRGNSYPHLVPEVEPYADFMEWAVLQCASGSWNGFRMKSVTELIEVIVSPTRRNLCLKFPCGAGREFVVASADRRVLACDATYAPSFSLGTLDKGLGASQRSGNARSLYERENWLLTEAECATCPWLHYCAGTCMAKAMIKYKTIKSVDEFECAVRKRVFPIIFQQLLDTDSRLTAYYTECR